MTTYQLTAPQFLDPLWFGKVRHGKHSGTVSADGSTVSIEGVPLAFLRDHPDPGTAVQVWIGASGFFVCATDADLAKAQAEQLATEQAARKAHQDRLNARRIEAEAFNAQILLPVKWKPGIKDVLSGLTESSMGDGRNRSTVEHIYLLEPLVAGRLVRQAGDFLCTAAAGSNGKRWSSEITEAVDGDGHRYEPKVTCKSCLALARRWMQREPTESQGTEQDLNASEDEENEIGGRER